MIAYYRKLAQEYSVEVRQSQYTSTPPYRPAGTANRASVLRVGDQVRRILIICMNSPVPSHCTPPILIGLSFRTLLQQAVVRLHNHASNRSIGELFRVITHDRARIRFQLNDRQVFLRVGNAGSVTSHEKSVS